MLLCHVLFAHCESLFATCVLDASQPSYDCKSCEIDLTWRCPVKQPPPPPPKKAPTW